LKKNITKDNLKILIYQTITQSKITKEKLNNTKQWGVIYLITNIISKLLAMIMLLLIPISFIGMFFNFWLFLEILTFDLITITMLLVFTEQFETTRMQKVGYAFIGCFYFVSIILNAVMADTIFLTISQVFALFFETIGLALVIAGKEVAE